MTRQARITKAQLAATPKVDLDEVQDHPPGPQAEFDDWCDQQDQQFAGSIAEWR